MVCWAIRVGSCSKEKRLRPHLLECLCPQNNTHHVPKHCADEGSKNTVILEVCVTKFATTLVLPSKNDGGHHTPESLSENLSRNLSDLSQNLSQNLSDLSQNLSESVGICRKNLSESVGICRLFCCISAVLSCIKEKSTKTRVLTNPHFQLILKTCRKTCRNLSESVAKLVAKLVGICRWPPRALP